MEVPIPSRLKLPADPENTSKFISFVSDMAGKRFTDQERISEIVVAVEEALVNITSHAYLEEEVGEIEVTCGQDDDGRFVIEISDTGEPFDVLSSEEPDHLLAEIDDRPIGGLGIFLIKELMDDVQYRREEGKNILQLVAVVTG